jgi:hypothetical protein
MEVQFLLIEKIPNKPFLPLKDWLNISRNTIVQLLFSEGTRSKTGVPKAFSNRIEDFVQNAPSYT